MRFAGALAGLALMLAATTPVATAQRRHPLHLPGAPLARALTVDESEWALRPSRLLVGSGSIRIRVYNRGEDDHDLLVVDHRGAIHEVGVKPGTDAVLVPNLAPGTYRFVCSLQAGTPESHEARGMRFTLQVR